MKTSYFSYCGFYIDIMPYMLQGGNAPYNIVRLTPHISDSSGNYIAIVLEDVGDDDLVELWTYQTYGDAWAYHGYIDKSSWYRFSCYIDSYNDYEVCFAAVGDTMDLISYGSFDGSRNCGIYHFLEHWTSDGSYPEHENSYWDNMYLYTTSSYIAWDTSVLTSSHNWTQSGTNPLVAIRSYINPTYEMRTWSDP
jgi:hypothetical protein